jgi:rare lipoprotein A
MRVLIAAMLSVCMAAQEPQPLVAVSFYASKYDGRKTTSGTRFSSKKLTAAHLTLPLGTRVRLTNPANEKSVEVVVNDRGPHVKGREISITRRAARELGIVRQGVGHLRMEVLP